MSDPESAGVAQRAEEEHGRVSVGNPFDTSGMEAVSLQGETNYIPPLQYHH